MTNETKTLQALSQPYTTGDLWDELNKDLNPYASLINFPNDQQFQVRFLGPFLHVRRLYVPNISLFEKYNLDVPTIGKTSPDVIGKILAQISNRKGTKPIQFSPTSEDMSSEACQFEQFLQKIYEGSGWQRCVMVNAFLLNSVLSNGLKIKVAPLIATLCQSIASRAGGNSDTKISGLNAHDVFITRRGTGLKTKFEIGLSKKPSFLSEEDLRYVFSRGLLDIRSLLNNFPVRHGGYLYKTSSNDYQMPDKFNAVLFKEMKSQEEDRQIEDVEKCINDLPLTAFENHNKMKSSINSLEIE